MILARSSTPLLLAAVLAAGCTSDSTDMLDRNDESSTARAPSSTGDGDAPAPSLALAAYDGARAHWLAADLIAIPAGLAGATFSLVHAPEGGLAIRDGVLVGGASIALTVDGAGLPADVAAKFPHLAAYRALRLPEGVDVAAVLRSQLAVVGLDGEAEVSATGVQTPGVLDDLFAYDGELGVTFAAGRAPGFRLWAPTARAVTLHVHAADRAEIAAVPMTRGERGVWSFDAAGDAWYGAYYRYEVEVFAPAADSGVPDGLPGAVVRNLVTDPYSVGLSTNSEYSLVVDLEDPATKPAGWDGLEKPTLAAPEDVALYELHIRDFSISDATVAPADRGKYRAFTYDGRNDADDRPASDGMCHLADLAQAGLTHVHLLPAFDIATIEEDASAQVNLDSPFADLCDANAAVPAELCMAAGDQTVRQVLDGILAAQGGTTEEIQAIVGYLRDLDGFNWGYDPYHFSAPEGSYASTGEGVARIVEFRAMVQGLARSGLRTVMDVVYNHTNASGQAARSVLDRIVPGYYHRRNAVTGEVERSTCCENTATEHVMMEKLMTDSLVSWATHFKVDGFRFDLMGHHMKANLERARDRLRALTLADDGVDGQAIYLYGEGWDFGEVGGGARGVNATQGNMAGTGIGTFSDRLRDAVRGGGPFDSGDSLRRNQGFVNGMFYDPNELNSGAPSERDTLLHQADLIKVGMAGNLRDFVLTDMTGADVAGSAVSYNGSPAGYTLDPQEVITYVSAHDNQTLFDNNQYKLPAATSMSDRARVQNLAFSIALLGQGIPFLHAGDELLRSKSMERDSYNSGDWYNRLDFTGSMNNWNVGLPRADNDGGNYPVIRPIVENPIIRPRPKHTLASAAHVEDMLRIRKSSRLFRLPDGAQVSRRVDFLNAGPGQVPGLLVMTITDGACAGDDLDPALDGIVVLINATTTKVVYGLAGTPLEGLGGFELHPVQRASSDYVLHRAKFDGAAFTVPARTAVVFVQPQDGAQGVGLPCNLKVPTETIPEPGELTTTVFLRGEMNDWGTAAPFERVADYTYEVAVPLAAGTYQFKVASEDWSTYDFGKSSAVVSPGDSLVLERAAGNITLVLDAAATVRFQVSTATDVTAPVLSLTAE